MVEADGDDLVHSDGKSAVKAVQLIQQHASNPFFLAVGFVRPHVPFVAPKKYEDAAKGVELFDTSKDPQQNTNLAGQSEFTAVVADFQSKLAAKLRAVRDSDLNKQ